MAAYRPDMNLAAHPHRRLNPLTREWVLVSPQRTLRPWLGQIESPAAESKPEYDPGCYLCPGNERAGGRRNPQYEGTFLFENDFAALLPGSPEACLNRDGLLVAEAERGLCHVICFSPRHDLTLARMDLESIVRVVDVWVEQYVRSGADAAIGHVQIFENRGAMMGASNPHPHCQIWSTASLPNEAAKEQAAQEEYRRSRGACLLCDYVELERAEGVRWIAENEHFSVVTPFWALWPFETLVVARRHVGALDELDAAGRRALADILQRVTARYDNLFATEFPYSMGVHQRPTDGLPHPEWHLHLHFYPPLLRSATIRKFMVGFELLGTPQRDLTAEEAAERLRATPERSA